MIGRSDCGGRRLSSGKCSFETRLKFKHFRIQSSKILVLGSMTSAAQELVKNLALKGVLAIVLVPVVDLEAPLSGHDSAGSNTNLFRPAPGESVAEATARLASLLNPHVKISVSQACNSLESATADNIRRLISEEKPTFVVFATRHGEGVLSKNDLIDSHRLIFASDEASLLAGAKFCWMHAERDVALLVNDFGPHHEFFVKGGSPQTVGFSSLRETWDAHIDKFEHGGYVEPKRLVKSVVYPASSAFLACQRAIETRQSMLSSFRPVDSCDSCDQSEETSRECPAVGAIVGGLVAQEVVKGVTGKDLPIQNVLLFDGLTLESSIIHVC